MAWRLDSRPDVRLDISIASMAFMACQTTTCESILKHLSIEDCMTWAFQGEEVSPLFLDISKLRKDYRHSLLDASEQLRHFLNHYRAK